MFVTNAIFWDMITIWSRGDIPLRPHAARRSRPGPLMQSRARAGGMECIWLVRVPAFLQAHIIFSAAAEPQTCPPLRIVLLKAEELRQSPIESVDMKAGILSAFDFFTLIPEGKSVSDIRFQSQNHSVRLRVRLKWLPN